VTTAARAPATTSYREAVREALREALARDDRVFLMGEDVGRYGGSYAVSSGLLEEFGDERVRDTPLSELTFVGAGIGAAMAGMRPIVEIMTINFSLLALDQIVNTAAAMRHMSGDQFGVPLVIRMATGGAAARWRPSTRTASRAGTRTFRASACSRPPQSTTRAACSGPPSWTPTRW
jgi:pyruvate/2-oxoglutarate/acetoin dehydrogenase E1 component